MFIIFMCHNHHIIVNIPPINNIITVIEPGQNNIYDGIAFKHINIVQ
jgi:hypothetical protein